MWIVANNFLRIIQIYRHKAWSKVSVIGEFAQHHRQASCFPLPSLSCWAQLVSCMLQLHIQRCNTFVVSIQTCEQRQVSHFQYLSWPDYGVPTSAVTLIDFLGAVKRQQRKMVKALGLQWTGHPLGPPIVVHCSAGIGRTGGILRLCLFWILTITLCFQTI